MPRNVQSTALIGDPRNDENLIVASCTWRSCASTTGVVADIRDDLGPLATPAETFAEAQRDVRWHYQWMILHDFLPLTAGRTSCPRS